MADLRALFTRDPKLGYAVMERAAQALLERLQATRHKLRVLTCSARAATRTARRFVERLARAHTTHAADQRALTMY